MDWERAQTRRVGAMESSLLEMGELVCVRHRIPAGFDSAPLYRGLPDDACPCEHWCYLVSGSLRYRFASDEGVLTVGAGDAFHLRAGHLAEVLEDAELIEFTDAAAYRRKARHLESRQVEDRASGELIVFSRTAEETSGELLEVDDFWPHPDHRTPEHVHPEIEEEWEVIAGRVEFEIGGVERTLGPGETIVAPPGTPHRARAVGDEPPRLRIRMRPALRWQKFVERLFRLELDGEGGRDQAALAALMSEFAREIAPPG
jgi:quercetin dioxygenase-like cupin family protein